MFLTCVGEVEAAQLRLYASSSAAHFSLILSRISASGLCDIICNATHTQLAWSTKIAHIHSPSRENVQQTTSKSAFLKTLPAKVLTCVAILRTRTRRSPVRVVCNVAHCICASRRSSRRPEWVKVVRTLLSPWLEAIVKSEGDDSWNAPRCVETERPRTLVNWEKHNLNQGPHLWNIERACCSCIPSV